MEHIINPLQHRVKLIKTVKTEDSQYNRPPKTVVSTPAPTYGANSFPVAAGHNYVHGMVNHVAVEEAQEVPDVVIGTFFINDTSTILLFDSRATHSFISTAYVEKHNLPIALLRCQMIVSSPRYARKAAMPKGEP
jgi:hypothetical protein